MYRYTQVGSEFLLLQIIKKKNTPLISQLVRESIRTSFQTNAVFLVDIWILNPVFHACVMDPLHARTVAIRVGNEIKYSFLLLQPSLYCFSLHHRSWSVFIPDGSGRRITDLGACTSAPSQLKPAPSSHGSSSTARLTVTVTSHCLASPAHTSVFSWWKSLSF